MSLSTSTHASPEGTNGKTAHRRMSFIAAIATLGGFLFGYDTGVISGALLYIADDLGLSAGQQSIVVSSLLIGAAFGGSLGGRFSDSLGRRRVILIAAILFGIGTLGSALSTNIIEMVVFRVILGLAVGCVSAVVPLYIGEVAPVQRRGRLVNTNELMIVFGQLTASVVNAIISVVSSDTDIWRWMLGVALVPAVLLFIGCFFLPESPRWLVRHDEEDKAREVMGKLRTPDDAKKEFKEITEWHSDPNSDSQGSGVMRYLAARWARVLILVGIGVSLCQQLAGVNAVVYYAPTLLEQTGLGASASVSGNIAVGVMGMLGVLLGMYLVRHYDRRPMLMTGQLAVIACHLTIMFMFLFMSTGDVRSIAILAMMTIFVFFQQCFISTVTWLALAELFPMQIRGFAMGISVFFQWAANFGVSLAFPNVAADFGAAFGFGGFAVLSLLGFIFVKLYLPETRNKSLEQLAREFKDKYSQKGASSLRARSGAQ